MITYRALTGCRRRYQARAACFADEYGGFRIDDGTPVDGRLTLGENLADNGGLRLAWDALRPSTMPELAAAFSCPAGAAMAPATRCRLW